MKILVLSPGEPSFVNSGLGIAANALNKELKLLVNLVVVQPENIPADEEAEEKIEVVINQGVFSEEVVAQEETKISVSAHLDPYHYGVSSQGAASKMVSSDVINKEIENYTQQVLDKTSSIEFDLIYAHDWITLQTAVALKEKTGKPFVAHIHSLDYDRGATTSSSFVFDIEQKALKTTDAIIAVSNYTAAILTDKYGINPAKINVVYNAIKPFKLPKVKKHIPEKLVLFVGRLTGQKGPGIFMEIAESLMKIRTDVRFVMVGSGELLKDLIERGANPLSSGKFHFTGNITPEEVLELYAMSDVYCMPSVSEPFGLTAIEAAYAGVPVVLSKQSGAAELLKGAFLANASDTETFTKHIDGILTDPKTAQKAIDSNLKCLEALTWKNAAKEINSIFNSCIKKH